MRILDLVKFLKWIQFFDLFFTGDRKKLCNYSDVIKLYYFYLF